MKKNWVLIFLVLSVYAANAFGDSASPGRMVTTNVMVTNLDQYPDIVLLAYADREVHTVGQNQPLPSYSYLGSGCPSSCGVRNLLAIKKDVLEAAGGVNTIVLAVLKQKYTPGVVIDPRFTYVAFSNPLASRTYLYRITGVTADAVSLKLYQGSFTFADGRDPVVVSY